MLIKCALHNQGLFLAIACLLFTVRIHPSVHAALFNSIAWVIIILTGLEKLKNSLSSMFFSQRDISEAIASGQLIGRDIFQDRTQWHIEQLLKDLRTNLIMFIIEGLLRAAWL